MSVARINMLEFETEDDLNKRAELVFVDNRFKNISENINSIVIGYN